MSFWDTASSIAGAAKGKLGSAKKVLTAAKGIKNTLTGKGSILNSMGMAYRNSLFYDFSSIIRAKIYVFNYKYQESDTGYGTFTFIETLPVQLNPESYKRKKGGSWGIDTEEIMNEKTPYKDDDKEHMDLELKFNIVDEYKISTVGSTSPAPINLDEVTIISKLYEYRSSDKRVLFKWGPLAFLSYISHVDCTYDSFSPFGEPLSATVSLTLKKHKRNLLSKANIDIDDKYLSGALGTDWALIQTMDKAESIYESIKLNIESSETLPNISRRIKD